ncbi:uncharacterized protein LOC124279315, partial [Haliotis rubra]|uniref:uncharacterized protein LOC124279315 n=1 Tax=Haliotis rubra TaxID=36100 RepID=UPI001EE5F6DC
YTHVNTPYTHVSTYTLMSTTIHLSPIHPCQHQYTHVNTHTPMSITIHPCQHPYVYHVNT